MQAQPISNEKKDKMSQLDNQLEIEQNKNIFLQLHPRFAVVTRFTQPFCMRAVNHFSWINFNCRGPDGLRLRICLMLLDPEKYLHHLEGYDMSAAKKRELIHSVAAIMQSFIDRAAGNDPVQLRLVAKHDNRTATPRAGSSDKKKLSDTFKEASGSSPDGEETCR